jgi:predicted metal-dependent peptidase
MIDFVEARFEEHGVTKLIPDDEVIERHARHMLERQLIEKAIAEISEKIAKEAKTAALPIDLREHIERVFKKHPELSWDAAVARIVRIAGKGDR